MTTFVLMNAVDKTLFQSYYVKDRYAYRKVAQRYADKYSKIYGVKYEVIEASEYQKRYGHLTKKVRGLFGGEIEIGINTPACCDPSTETYWSM